MLHIAHKIFILESELSESFIRASGPGGQNVNKVSSAVQLRFNLTDNRSLPETVKMRLRHMAGARLIKDDVILIHAESFRTQLANRNDARRKLVELIRAAVPEPVKRKKTKPTKSSVERRLLAKKKTGLVKKQRNVRSLDQD